MPVKLYTDAALTAAWERVVKIAAEGVENFYCDIDAHAWRGLMYAIAVKPIASPKFAT